MRKQQRISTNILEHSIRLGNLLYAIMLNVDLGKTKDERFKTIAQYQAQANTLRRKLC